ncbi:MAG: hypothetical protein LUE20_03930 [Oscillospiraceae bacterium]|nr:hypothetical protein [Oscillospiraceae bacterium]
MLKKVLCVLLSVLMVVSLLPTGVMADDNFKYIYVNGVDILTATNYTVQCGSGTAVYNPETYTLTLTNATIDTVLSSDAIYFYANSAASAPSGGVTIELVGDNYINLSGSYAIESRYCDLTITSKSNGTLTIDGANYGIYLNSCNLNITDCTVTMTGIVKRGINSSNPVYITNSTVTMTASSTATNAIGIGGSGSLTVYIEDSDVTMTMSGKCFYNSNSTNSAYTSRLYVEDSQLTCTTTDSSKAAINLSGLTVSGDSTVIADGGLDLQIGTSGSYNLYAHITMSTEPAYFYYGSDSANLSVASSTSARSYTGSTAATTYYFSNYPYIMIVTGTGNGGPTPVSESSNGVRGVIYINEDYHAFILTRNSRRYLACIPHTVDSNGYCTVCKEYIGSEEEETVTIDDVEYNVVYSNTTSIAAGNWNQVTFDSDTSMMDALAADGAILVITRDTETLVSYADGGYEKILFIDSSWSNNNTLITLGTAGHTSADESDVIDCLSDDGITLTYDGATIYQAWVDGGYAEGGSELVLVSNTSASYNIVSVQVLVPVE